MHRHISPWLKVLVSALTLSFRAFAQPQPEAELPHTIENSLPLNVPPHLAVEPIETNTQVTRQPFELRGRILTVGERIEVSLMESEIVADGRSALHMKIRVVDRDNQPIASAVKVALDTQLGRFRLSDGRLVSSAYALVIDGQKDMELVASTTPGSNTIRVSSGPVSASGKMNFTAQARDLFAVGIADITRTVGHGTGDSNLAGKAGFEDNFHNWDAPNQSGVAYQNNTRRAAGFIKGTLFEDYVITGSYDSQKINPQKFFSDIDPNDYYPNSGDTSVVHYDARSTSKLYARIDQKNNYLMYGDFLSHEASEPIRLGSYSRTLNGARGHYDNGTLAATAFASRTSRTTMVDEQPGLGLSGPYTVSQPNALANSEQISIVVRDRYQPAIVVSRTAMIRHVDYEFEPFSGRILFREPVPSVDENLNPVSVRTTYEVEAGGPQFWVAGIDAQIKLTPQWTTSARYTKDDNPLTNKTLSGGSVEWLPSETTHILLDVAHSTGSDFIGGNASANTSTALTSPNGNATSSSGLFPDRLSGNAYRAEMSHPNGPLKAEAFVSRTDIGFENANSGINSGRKDAKAKVDYALSDTVSAVVQGRFSHDMVGQGEQSTLTAALRKKIMPNLTLGAGINHVREDYPQSITALGTFATPYLPSSSGATGLGNNSFASRDYLYNPFANPLTSNCALPQTCGIQRDYTSLYAEARYDISPAWNVDALVEQSVAGSAGQRLTLGSQYRVGELGRVYGRYEWVDKLITSYGFSDNPNTSHRFVLGADTAYMKDGNVFEELRLAEGGRSTQAVNAVGLRNIFHITDSLVANTSIENQVLISRGASTQTAKAIAGGLEYTSSPLWRIGGRLEYRTSETQNNWLSSASAVRRLNNDWSVLARNILLTSDGLGTAAGQNQTQDRLQLGLAYRDTATNLLNAIGRYEHNIDRNTGLLNPKNMRNDVVAVAANFRPRTDWTFSTSAAFKRQTDEFDGPSSTFNGKLISTRLMYDINDRFDVGVLASHSWGGAVKDRGYGTEVGYRVMKNLWLSGGYISGSYADSELYSTNNHWRAFYVRLRFKFDENLMKP